MDNQKSNEQPDLRVFETWEHMCGHVHSPQEWQRLCEAYARKVWKFSIIRAILTGEPRTWEVSSLQNALITFYIPRLPGSTQALRVLQYLEEVQQYLMLGPCRVNVTQEPDPEGRQQQ